MTHDVYTATVSCCQCPWSAQHTSDDANEAADFLRDLITVHCFTLHGMSTLTEILTERSKRLLRREGA